MAGMTILRWLPAILLAALLFVLSSQPELRIAPDASLDAVLRKLGHLGAYAALGVFVAFALDDGVARPRAALVVAIVAAYAGTDELHQAFVPGRGPSLVDVAI